MSISLLNTNNVFGVKSNFLLNTTSELWSEHTLISKLNSNFMKIPETKIDVHSNFLREYSIFLYLSYLFILILLKTENSLTPISRTAT